MRTWLKTAVPLLSVWAFGALVGCVPGDDDDTVTPTPTPGDTPTPTPVDVTPTPAPARITISGQVSAVDRSTGEAITSENYGSYAGAIVVYALRDPADLVHPIGKSTLVGPGYYSIDVPENSGPIYLVGVADYDFNKVITSADVAREALQSPVDVQDAPWENVDIVIDMSRHGGGGGSPSTVKFSGTVTYDTDTPTDIAVVAFPGDYRGNVWGLKKVSGSGPYEVTIYRYSETTALIAYADWDHNGLFEPSDPAGLAEANPYLLDQDRSGVDIVIEGVGPIGLPQPIPYVSVSGTVVADATYNNSPIQVELYNDAGVIYGKLNLEMPGDFSLRVPGNLSGVRARAISDNDHNGIYDVAVDASGSFGPFDVGGSSVGGITLNLVLPPAVQTGLSGIVSYNGTPGSSDLLMVALFDQPEPTESPVELLIVPAVFPYSYEFVDLPAGTYYVAGALDVGGDANGQAPGPEDITGGYSLAAPDLSPIVVTEDHMTIGVDFTLGL